jgi:hypothetical protein
LDLSAASLANGTLLRFWIIRCAHHASGRSPGALTRSHDDGGSRHACLHFLASALSHTERQRYEQAIVRFQNDLAGSKPPGFIGATSFQIEAAPWLSDLPGYEDWYLLDGTWAMDPLNAFAIGSDGVQGLATQLKMPPKFASQILAAFSSMLVSTGSRSPGKPLMTRSTSGVAACCSRASFSSRVSRATSVSLPVVDERTGTFRALRRFGSCVFGPAP